MKLFFRWFAPADLDVIIVLMPFLLRALHAMPNEPIHVAKFR